MVLTSQVSHWGEEQMLVRLHVALFQPTRILLVFLPLSLERWPQLSSDNPSTTDGKLELAIFTSKSPIMSSLFFLVHSRAVFCFLGWFIPLIFQLPILNINLLGWRCTDLLVAIHLLILPTFFFPYCLKGWGWVLLCLIYFSYISFYLL